MASNAINVCRIHTVGNIKKDVNCVTATTPVPLDNRVTCIQVELKRNRFQLLFHHYEFLFIRILRLS